MPEQTAIVPMTFDEWWSEFGVSGPSAYVCARNAWEGGVLEGRRMEQEWCKAMIDRHLPEGGLYAEST